MKTHSGEKSNKCNQCNFASSYASGLMRHLKTHTGEKSNKCNLCDYASSQAGHLRIHLKTHSGEKPNKRKHYDDVTVMIMTVMLLQGHIFHGVGDDGSHKKERKLFF